MRNQRDDKVAGYTAANRASKLYEDTILRQKPGWFQKLSPEKARGVLRWLAYKIHGDSGVLMSTNAHGDWECVLTQEGYLQPISWQKHTTKDRNERSRNNDDR